MPAGNPRGRKINHIFPFLLIALIFAAIIWQKYEQSRRQTTIPQIMKQAVEKSAVLFFVEDGTHLGKESRKIGHCAETTDCLKDVLAELLNGAISDLDDAIPPGTIINSLKIEKETAFIDLSHHFKEELPEGSSAEMLAVYSIVNTACTNFPEIKKVKLDIEGNRNVVLGHLDLSLPLEPDYGLERKPVSGHGDN